MTYPCPCCSGVNVRQIFETAAMPVNSCIITKSADVARAFPRAPIALWACATCHFLWNASFDAAYVDYGADYEATQIHSPYFRNYLSGLARDWMAEHQGTDCSVLEVGCGQGEFLQVLGDCSNATLMGYDPAFRGDAPDGIRIEALKLPDQPDRQYDLVINRMTLEHVTDPVAFLRQMRAWTKPNGALISQVPNAGRTLRDGLVCDLFYEHVNYFTETSLGAALKSAGLGHVAMHTGYDGQHLTAIARIGGNAGIDLPDPPDSPDLLGDNLHAFAGQWDRVLNAQLALGRKNWIWGTGSRATTFLSLLGTPDLITGAIDINPNRTGSYILGTGCETFLPRYLSGGNPVCVIAMNSIYEAEIRSTLDDLNVDATLHFVS